MMGIEQTDLHDDSQPEAMKESTAEARRRGRMSVFRWSDVQFQSEDDDSFSENSEAQIMPLLGENSGEDDASQSTIQNPDKQKAEFIFDGKSFSSSSRCIALKNLLDKWDEPVIKSRKVRNKF